jgi:catechol 2,3-dioxygenase-like lactoylglutathione lyase family enzyme
VLWLARYDAKSHDPERHAWCVGGFLGRGKMQQQISCVTVGVADIARSRRFYADGFGWKPVFEQSDIVFYQMNGLMLGTWLLSSLEGDMQRKLSRPGPFSIAHNVAMKDEVQQVMEHLALYGGRILLDASAPPHGGMRGYVADPDDHSWEIAWNPQWPISPEGYVTWGI